MINFVPFGESKKAQDVISEYINKPYERPPAINPVFDLREEGQMFPPLNPPVQTDPVVDPCPEGYQLIDGVCQPIDQFGGNMSNEVTGGGNDNEVEDRPYMSIEDMEGATDEDLLGYLTSGFLKNSPLGFLPSKGTQVTLGMNMFSPLLQLGFGNQNELRKNFIINELTKRGYFTGKFDDNQNAIFDIGNKNVNTNVGGIESALPQNTIGQPVTDAFGDTYQVVETGGGGSGMGYTFTPSDPSPSVGQETQSGAVYGTGRGGTADVKIAPSSFAVNYEEDYGADI